MHARLTDELAKEDPSIERISEIIIRDLGMTTKLLQLVNSAFFGLPQTISKPADAVVFLGLSTVRALAMSSQVFAQFDEKKVKGFSIHALEEHCWLTAILARRIAETEGCQPKIVDQCFLAGLLHDVGQLILAHGMPEQFARALGVARSQGQTLWEAERAEFGATHTELGAYLLGLWGLPNPIVEMVAMHHCPEPLVQCGFSPVIAVHVANSFAHEQIGNHSDWPGNQLNLARLAELGLSERLTLWRARCFEDGL